MSKKTKVPKPKKKKQPKKLVTQINMIPEVQKLSRPKKAFLPKKKNRLVPFALPRIDKAEYAEVEEYTDVVTRPQREVKRQVLI